MSCVLISCKLVVTCRCILVLYSNTVSSVVMFYCRYCITRQAKSFVTDCILKVLGFFSATNSRNHEITTSAAI